MEKLLLADQGRARLPIQIDPEACQGQERAAGELACYLRRITGAGFTATTRRRTMRGLPAALRSETDNIHLNNFLNL